MDILFCTSEAYPLIKTGGLGDVSGSLPRALRNLRNDVRMILPAYPEVLEKAGRLTAIARLTLTGSSNPVEILKGRFPGSDIPLYLVDAPEYFQRPGNPYIREDGRDWPDNAARFAMFARAIVTLVTSRLDNGWQPEIVHCNDWQTGLVPPLLSEHETRPATLFTIHNLAFQGLFPADTFTDLELPDTLWSIDGLEFHNMLSFLKGGIANADWVTTVSPTYAQEICSSEFGYGLEGLLQHRSANLSGILNGIDTDTWNPATDPHIDRNYDIHTLQHKVFNKLALQRDFGLPIDSHPLLLGHIGRLVEQKGADLILDILDELLQHPFQLIILGSGERTMERRLLDAAKRYPGQLAVHVGYDERIAHRIEAGTDCFLMPSRYEPCGLNQMYSLAYGTVPIVHCTGGLADSITDLNQNSADEYRATGFSFDDDSPDALLDACLRALNQFQSDRVEWWKLVISGMKNDFSWSNSAVQYLELYWHVCNTLRAGLGGFNETEKAITPSSQTAVETAIQDTRLH